MSPATSKPARVVIAGGGTGGHLFPGLALAEQLSQRGASITFVGTARGIEAKVVPSSGYPLELIEVSGLKRQGAVATLRSLLRLPVALLQTLRLLRKLRPDVVVGVGGYASGPVVLLASLLRIPTVVLEQNSIPGLTNRILSHVVRRVFTSFPHASRYFPRGKVELLGNPVRQSITDSSVPEPVEAVGPVRLLILGGSLGAKAVNTLLTDALAELCKNPPPALSPLREHLYIHHQTGPSDLEPTQQRYSQLPELASCVSVEPFISNMASAYRDCDLMIGRAGATTIAELTALGRPAVLIPFPFAADDHQTHNARYLVEHGAARMLLQKDTTPGQLAQVIVELCQDRTVLTAMASASRRLGKPDAAKRIADEVLRLAT
ncbi:MAG: undecaprenyldiphospho-muramoylpentapeptide beta-N-acetylglucosaminyltransferase [Myxococcales bacterium]|nr:undecaprenyldiphospho-muramoylpentapeptide beta-N-acetylglucosaminyltransferase [Myxococcales bacterium]